MGCANSCQRKVVPMKDGPLGQPLQLDNAARFPDDKHHYATAAGDRDAIAIVGIACRTAGADNIQEYWRLMKNGECHIRDVPPDRWNASAYFSEDLTLPCKAYVQKGGFMNDIYGFDNGLYGINDYEASQMDPQQCMLLDCTTMALEDAGITRTMISGSNTGVFVGAMNTDHKLRSTGFSSVVGNYTAAGVATCFLSSRLSFAFNLLGPCITIDSACSASIVGIHLACQAILTGDCDQAICGGVNCMEMPDVFISLCKARMISPTGLCQTFSDQADGYGRGEGCGVVILKRLTDAIRDGDHIWATICTGYNQNGHTVTPLTAPSFKQQKNLLQSVYDKFQIDVNDLDYIEAHGTGTFTGDLVEVNALGSFLKERGQPRERHIGSVKTNIGHTESASGVLNIIKVCLMMQNNLIVPSLHCKVVNPNINMDGFVIPKCTVPWEKADKMAACNSFGVGGSNSHAVLKTVKKNGTEKEQAHGLCIVCFSGRSISSLKGSLEDLTHDPAVTDLNVHDVSYTSTVRRDHYGYRAAFLAHDMQNLLNAVSQRLSQDKWSQPVLRESLNTVFVFCGMGTAWAGMCRQLLEEHQVFKDALMEVQKHLSKYVSWSLVERLREEDPSSDPLLEHIAVFACQVGLSTLWGSLGIRPSCVVGQSIGEVAAAYTAGCFSLADAVKIVFHRGQVLAEATGGSMVVVQNVEVDNVRQVLTQVEDASISQVYSSKACAISAPCDSMLNVKRTLQCKLVPEYTGIQIKDLKVRIAYHSPHVSHCGDKLAKQLNEIVAHPPTIPMQSSVTGTSLTSSPGAEYWVMNLTNPVLFQQAITATVTPKSKKTVFLEIGPKPVLKAHLKEIFPSQKVIAVASMSKQSEVKIFYKAAIGLYEEGLDIKWTAMPSKGSEPTKVPRYCFDKKNQAKRSETQVILARGVDYYQKSHLYTAPIVDTTTVFQILISPLTIPSVYDHLVSGKITVPGAFFAEAGFAVAHYLQVTRPAVNIEFEHITTLKTGEMVEFIAEFGSFEKVTRSRFPPLIIKRENRRLASVQLEEFSLLSQERINLDYIHSKCKDAVDKGSIYSFLKKAGFQYGPAYSLLEYADRTSTECLAFLKVADSIKREISTTIIHPSILDSMLQSCSLIFVGNDQHHSFLPKSMGRLTVHRAVESPMYVYARQKQNSNKEAVFDVQLLSSEGWVIAELVDFVIQILHSHEHTKESMTLLSTRWIRVKDTPTFSLTECPQVQEKTPFLFVTDEDVIKTNGHNLAVNYTKKDTFDCVEEEIKTALASCQSLAGVVFVCLGETDDDEDSEAIHKRVVSMCCLIQVILRTMKTLSLKAAFYACTVDAWPAVTEKTHGHKTNPVATALWGLLRTVILENVYSPVRTVDLCLSSGMTKASLPSIFRFIAETERVYQYPELLVTAEGVFANQIVKDSSSPLSQHVHIFTENNLSDQKGYKQTPGSFPALEYPSNTNNTKQSSTMLKMHAFVPGTDALFTRGSISNSQQFMTESGCPDVAIEMKGHLSEGSDVEIACCCPVLIKSEVSVPSETVIPIALMPNYQLGDLSKLVIIWELRNIVRKKGVTILASMATRHWAELLNMLSTPSSEVESDSVSTVLLEDLERSVAFRQTVVSLVYLDTNLTSSVLKYWQTAEHLVTFTSLISPEAVALMSYTAPNTEVTLLNLQKLFHPVTLKKTISQLQTWMNTDATHMKGLGKSLHQVVSETKTADLNTLLKFSNPTTGKQFGPVTMGTCFKKDAAYVVVGGLTGLGWICVEFLAHRNAGFIAIINRSIPSADQVAAINNLLLAHKCQIKTYQADITSMESVKETFSQISSTKFQLRGVFMGAALLHDSTFLMMSEEDFDKVLSPKIKGAWNLHLICKRIDLDYFVLQSSVVSVLGNAGQANYVTANAFLDGLAYYRRDHGLPAQTINWGPLEMGLLDQKDHLKKKMEFTGIQIASREQTYEILSRVLMLKQTQTIPARIDPQLFVGRLNNFAEKSFFIRFQKVATPPSQDLTHHNMEPSRIKFLEPERRRQAYEIYLTEVVSQLMVTEITLISCDVSMKDLGMDSMSSTMLLDQIQLDTSVTIPYREIFTEETTISSLAEMLEQSVSNLT